MKRSLLATLAVVSALCAAPVVGAVKVGFVTTLTTPAAVIGNDMRDAVELALEHLAGQGGVSLEVVYGDDEFNPQKGKQATERLIRRDRVDIVAGYIWSNVLLASARTVLDAGKLLISANAGPSQMAGAGCHPNYFNIAWQNDQTPMAMGEVLNQRGVKSLYLIAPNYAAGKNMLAGVERTFKGEVVGRDLTRWPDQLDWAAELSKVRSVQPDGVFIFYPGKHGPAFVTQYQQSGLRDQVPLYTVFTIDALSLPSFQQAGMDGVLGTINTQHWGPDLDNAQNRRFVADFRARHGRYPSFYAAQSYDAMFMIKDAVDAVDGDPSRVEAMRTRMRAAAFASTRGAFTFGRNNHPVQNFYSREVVVDAEGNWTTSIRDVVLANHVDPYAHKCRMAQ